jgi:hypothetical protein
VADALMVTTFLLFIRCLPIPTPAPELSFQFLLFSSEKLGSRPAAQRNAPKKDHAPHRIGFFFLCPRRPSAIGFAYLQHANANANANANARCSFFFHPLPLTEKAGLLAVMLTCCCTVILDFWVQAWRIPSTVHLIARQGNHRTLHRPTAGSRNIMI